MRVKRNRPETIRSYFIEYPNSVKGNGVSFHILNEKRAGVNNFIFLLSRTDGEVSLPNEKDIFATVSTNSNDVKFLLNAIGYSVQEESKRVDRPSHDYDIIEKIKEKTQNIDLQINVANNASRYLSKEQKIELERIANAKPEKRVYTSDEKEILKIRPYALLKTLHDNQIIYISKEEPNGNELKVKFEFVDQSKYGNKKFNISVAKLDSSAGNKAQLFNDFANQKNKDLGMGSVALVAHLGENGFFDFNELSNEDKVEYAKDYFKNNLLSLVPENYKMEHNDDGGKSIYFKNKVVTFQPIEREVPYVKSTMIDFIRFRGISQETIDSLIENNNLIFGDFYNSRITVEFDNDGNEKKNYAYKNAPYFRLHEGWMKPGYKLLNSPFGAERFEVKRTPTGPKPFEYDKKNIGSVDGKYWTYGDQHQPEKALIHEAIIDGISSLEIFKETDSIDPNKQRYFSIQGTSHLKKFFQKNIGFWSETKKIKGVDHVHSTYQEYKEFKNPLDDFALEQYREKLGHKEIVFFRYPETNIKKRYIENNLKEIQNLFGCKLNIVDKNERSDIYFDDYRDKDVLLVDEHNYNDFLDSICLNIFYNKKKGQYDISTVNEKFYSRELNDFNKTKIKSQIKSFFGTEHLVFVLDNDHAGLKFMKVFTELERHLGIPVSYMLPDDLASTSPYEEFKGMSSKDMHSKYCAFVQKGEFDEAYKLLDNYISQRPNIDNNDVLKAIQKAKTDNPQLAKQLIESKLEQLKPVHSPDGLAIRNVQTAKKNNRPRNKP